MIKTQKRNVFGEIYTTGKKFYTAGGSDGSDKSHLWVVIKVVIWDFRWIGKAGTEFFTGSQDGYMKWWDIR